MLTSQKLVAAATESFNYLDPETGQRGGRLYRYSKSTAGQYFWTISTALFGIESAYNPHLTAALVSVAQNLSTKLGDIGTDLTVESCLDEIIGFLKHAIAQAKTKRVEYSKQRLSVNQDLLLHPSSSFRYDEQSRKLYIYAGIRKGAVKTGLTHTTEKEYIHAESNGRLESQLLAVIDALIDVIKSTGTLRSRVPDLVALKTAINTTIGPFEIATVKYKLQPDYVMGQVDWFYINASLSRSTRQVTSEASLQTQLDAALEGLSLPKVPLTGLHEYKRPERH